MFEGAAERIRLFKEPKPLGFEIDLESARLWELLADGLTFEEINRIWQNIGNIGVRQRALAVLTAPYGYRFPYYAPHEKSIGDMLNIEEAVGDKTSCTLRERFADQRELANELAKGVCYWLTTTKGRVRGANIDSRYDYQTAIKQLLPIVDMQMGEKLLSNFSINDPEPSKNWHFCTGYIPVQSLLSDPEIPNHYKTSKTSALQKWFTVAESEYEGKSTPRENYEDAMKCMADFVGLYTYADSVDNSVVTSIIDFFERHKQPTSTYVNNNEVISVASHITDSDLFFDFVWRHVFTADPNNQLTIDSEIGVDVVNAVRQEANRRISDLNKETKVNKRFSGADRIADSLIERYNQDQTAGSKKQAYLKKAADVKARRRGLW